MWVIWLRPRYDVQLRGVGLICPVYPFPFARRLCRDPDFGPVEVELG